MNATVLKRLRVNGGRPSAPARPAACLGLAQWAPYQKRRFHRPRRRRDPRQARPEGSQFQKTGWIVQLFGLVAASRFEKTGRRRRSGDPMLVFNMSIFNSANVSQCIFKSLPQRENVW